MYLCSKCGAILPKTINALTIQDSIKNFFCTSELEKILSNPKNRSMKKMKKPITKRMNMGLRTNNVEYPA